MGQPIEVRAYIPKLHLLSMKAPLFITANQSIGKTRSILFCKHCKRRDGSNSDVNIDVYIHCKKLKFEICTLLESNVHYGASLTDKLASVFVFCFACTPSFKHLACFCVYAMIFVYLLDAQTIFSWL